MKLTQKVFFGWSIMAVSLSLIIMACQKESAAANSAGSTKKLSVYLADDPCQYDSVSIDIRTVEVKIDTNTEHMSDDHFGDNDNDKDDDNKGNDNFGKWDTLTINAGVYNILKLRNGIDTLLGDANVAKGSIRKIRLTLGTKNSVVKNGITYPLSLLSGINNYVYIKINKEHEDIISTAQSAIWIDFDVCESIKLIGGQYYLKPFCKPFGLKNFGRVEGKVLPAAANAFVKAYNSTDSATAIPEDDGEYRIRGLKEGTYSISFKGSNGYSDTTITNVQIMNGQEANVSTVTLHL